MSTVVTCGVDMIPVVTPTVELVDLATTPVNITDIETSAKKWSNEALVGKFWLLVILYYLTTWLYYYLVITTSAELIAGCRIMGQVYRTFYFVVNISNKFKHV